MALQSVVDGHDRDHDHNDDPDLSNDNDDNDADHDHQDDELETDINDDHEQQQQEQQQQSPFGDQSAHDRAVDAFLRPLKPDDATLYRLACSFSDIYRDLARNSDQQFLPTPVTRLPSGHETGRYLAIDVGGSNLRVAFIELLGDSADDNSDNGARSRDVSGGAAGKQQRKKAGGRDGASRSRDTMRKAQRQRVRRTLEKTWPIGEHRTDRCQ